jgi:hypothetical protein
MPTDVQKSASSGQNVRTHENGFAHRTQFFEQRAKFDARARVEARCGFVQKQQFRVVNQSFRQTQTLFHATAQTFDVGFALLGEVGEF